MTKAGSVIDTTEERYHANEWGALSRSEAWKIVNDCPARYKHELTAPREATASLDFGRLAHCFLLEREKFNAQYAVLPDNFDGRTKEGKALRAKIEAENKRAISDEDFQTVLGMAGALKDHPFAMAAFSGGYAEKTLLWEDEATGVLCRCRPDYLPAKGNIIADYKTCRTAKPEELRKTIYQYGLHFQAAWYLEAAEKAAGIKEPQFVFIFQEKTPPYLITAVSPSAGSLILAQAQAHRARLLYKECRAKDEWPGYAGDVLTLDLPTWAYKIDTEQAFAGGF